MMNKKQLEKYWKNYEKRHGVIETYSYEKEMAKRIQSSVHETYYYEYDGKIDCIKSLYINKFNSTIRLDIKEDDKYKAHISMSMENARTIRDFLNLHIP